MASEYAYVGKSVTDLSTVTQADGGSVAAGDFVVFGEGNQQAITSGLTTWNALSAGGGNDGLARIDIKRPFTGNIGGNGGSLEADVAYGSDAQVVYDAGGGSFFYKPVGTANTCDRFRNIGFGRATITGGTTTNYEGNGGAYGMFNGSAVCTNAWVFGGTLDALNNGTAFTLLHVEDATANIQRDMTTLSGAGNAVVTVSRDDSSSTKPVATTINWYGGTLYWRGGAITTLNLFGGMIDLSQVQSAITITNVNASKQAAARSKWNLASTKVTVTNTKVYGGLADSLTAA